MPIPLEICDKKLAKADYSKALLTVLNRLSEAAKHEDFSSIEFPKLDKLFRRLHKISCDGNSKKEERIEHARCIASILQAYSENLPYDKHELDNQLAFLANSIGSITTLCEEPPELPEDPLFTKTFTKNRDDWKVQPCPEPARKGKDPIYFLKKDNQSVVRTELRIKADSERPFATSMLMGTRYISTYWTLNTTLKLCSMPTTWYHQLKSLNDKNN